MAFAIITFDKPDHAHVRDQHRAAHYEFLQQHQAKLIASGGLQDDAGEQMRGGLILLVVETVVQAWDFVRSDPFTTAALFARVEVVRWKKAFFDGRRINT